MKVNMNFGKIEEQFYIVFQANKAREISKFQVYQTKFWDKYISKKADSGLFSFWVNAFSQKEANLI